MCLFSQSSVHSPKTLSEHRNLRIYPTVPHTTLHARATNKTKQQTPTGIWHSTQTNTADFSLVGTTQALFPIVIVTESSLTDHYNCAGRVSISLLSDEIPDLPCSYCRYEFKILPHKWKIFLVVILGSCERLQAESERQREYESLSLSTTTPNNSSEKIHFSWRRMHR